jgi:hypothetical protein
MIAFCALERSLTAKVRDAYPRDQNIDVMVAEILMGNLCNNG